MFDSGYKSEIEQIESIAETKGIDIDDIEVNKTETKEGDDMVVFRILETKAETEEDSVGVQVSKVPSVQTGEMAFRNDVQQKLNALKKHLSGENEGQPQGTDEEVSDGSSASDRSTQETRSTRNVGGSGPGSEIDSRLRALEEDYEELDERLSELEEKAEALDGLQKLMGED